MAAGFLMGCSGFSPVTAAGPVRQPGGFGAGPVYQPAGRGITAHSGNENGPGAIDAGGDGRGDGCGWVPAGTSTRPVEVRVEGDRSWSRTRKCQL